MDRPVAVVTGASGGIGRWIALGLAQAGLHVVMVVRNRARGEAAQAWIATSHEAASTELVLADLSSMAQTRAAGAAIATAHPAIKVLVNNAGLFTPKRVVTNEGREMVLAVNHLAPFLLSEALAGPLRAGAPSRLVNVGSTASDSARLQLDDLELARGWTLLRAYGQSKLAIMMSTFERARRMAGAGVDVHVVHPGLVATAIGTIPGPIGLVWRALSLVSLTEEQGAVTPLHVALAPQIAGQTGLYWKKSLPARPNRIALDRAACIRLWGETEKLLG